MEHQLPRAAHDGAVEGRVAVVVDRGGRIAELEQQLHRLQRLAGAARALARRPDADAGGDEQRGGAVLVRQQRVGAQRQQQAHHLQVDRLGGEQERRGAPAVERVPVAVARLGRLAGVDVGAAGDQRAGQLQVGHGPGRKRGRVVVVPVRAAGPDELVQRRPARPGSARIGPVLQQPRRHVIVRVDDRQMQRAGAVRQGEVHVGPGREQGLDGGAVTGAHRERQRREAGVGTGVDVGARRRQRRDHRRVPLGRRPHQRGLPAPSFPRVHPLPGAVPEQGGHAVDDAGPRRRHQRGLAVRRRPVRVRPGREQRLHRRRMAPGAGQGQRGHPEAGRRVSLSPGVQQEPHRRRVSRVGRPVQRRRVVGGLRRGRAGGGEHPDDGAGDAPRRGTERRFRTALHHAPPGYTSASGVSPRRRPVLSPSPSSSRTPALSSWLTSRFVIGVSRGYRRWRPPRNCPPPPPTSSSGRS